MTCRSHNVLNWAFMYFAWKHCVV